MSIDTNLPMELYKANVQLWMQMNLLLQETRQQWADLGDKTLGDDVDETRAELDELAKATDWKDLTNLPGSAIWHHMQKRVGDLQACTETAIAEQTRFASGLQQALASWQKATTQAFTEAGKSLPMAVPLKGTVPDFGALMAMFTPAGKSAATKPAKGKSHAE